MTVRARLTLWYSGLLVLIVVAFAFASYVYVARLEHDRIERLLHEQSEIVVQAITNLGAGRGTLDGPAAPELLGTLHDLRARGIRAWIFDDDGRLRVSTADVQEGEGPEEEISVLGDTVPLALLRRAAQRHTAMVTEVPAGDHGTARLLTTPLPGNVGEGVLLTASFAGETLPFSDGALIRMFITHPLLTLKVVGAIHWEALKIWLKGVPLRDRPAPPAAPATVIPRAVRLRNA